jgi:hypothetical protein
MVDVVSGDDAWTRLTGAVEDVNLLLREESSWKRLRGQPFFFARP